MPSQKNGDKVSSRSRDQLDQRHDPIDPTLSDASGPYIRTRKGAGEVHGGVDRPVQVQGQGHREVKGQGLGREGGQGRKMMESEVSCR